MNQSRKDIRTDNSHITRRVILLTVGVVVLSILNLGNRYTREARIQQERGNAARSANLLTFLYAEERDHVLPPLVIGKNGPGFDLKGTHPAYAIDAKVTGPLKDTHAPLLVGELGGYKAYTLEPAVDFSRFHYLGYVLTSDAEGLVFVEACRKHQADGGGFEEDLPAPAGKGSFGGDRFLRLRTDLAQVLVAQGVSTEEAQRRIGQVPVLIDRPQPGARAGGWVVYLDRHSAYLPYPGVFPMTERFLQSLDTLRDSNSPPEQ